MKTVRLSVSIEMLDLIVEYAERKGITIAESTEKIVGAGYNRLESLEKWKAKGRKKTARRVSSGIASVDRHRKKTHTVQSSGVRHRVAA
jgi:hypothetical protein